jgi:MinD superfamily P-loop ATPase
VSPTIAVASGKGGTGKTTVAVGLALALSTRLDRLQFIDCDVEEPNADIFIKPVMDGGGPVNLEVPRVDNEKCTGCGQCQEICEFNAVAVVKGQAIVFENVCHSCGGCALVCPEKAISEEPRTIGEIERGARDNIDFMRGVLRVGEAMATPIIRALRGEAREGVVTIMDSPPGTACPVIATVQGADYALLVTEPTPFGLYDLDMMVQVVRELGVPCGLVINKDDDWSRHIREYGSKNDIPVLMTVPFSRDLAVLYSKGLPLNTGEGDWDREFLNLYDRIGAELCQSL